MVHFGKSNMSAVMLHRSVDGLLFDKCQGYVRAVIFNRGSAEPQGSASICQGFHSWPV